jgi:hypothetical protein
MYVFKLQELEEILISISTSISASNIKNLQITAFALHTSAQTT